MPSKQYAPKDDLTWTCTDEERKPMLDKIAKDIVKSFLIATVIDHWVHVLRVL